jgi:HK97 family phage portal protein
MGWRDRLGLTRRDTSQLVEYDPETGFTREAWDSMPQELRALLPWNVYGADDPGRETTSGANVTEGNSFKMGVVFAAITLIADGVASLPPRAFTEAEDGSRTSQTVPQWIRKPHPEIRRFDVFNQLLVSALAWGDGFARFIRRPSDGVIIGLNVLKPENVHAEWDPEKPGYRRYRLNGSGPWLTSYDIFHIQGPTLPGEATGMSVIKYAREAIGLGLTLEEYGARYFGQGSQAKIVLEIPSNVDEPKAKAIVRTFERFHRGKNNWHRPAIVSGGAKLHQISIPPDDAQFLQSREHQAIDIARWFRVPPHRVGIVSASTSWGSGLAEQNMAMLQGTFGPWITRLQDALTMYAPGGQDFGTIIELETDALLRGTFKEQVDMWTVLYEKDVATKNEARQKLGLAKVPKGDKFFSETAAKEESAPATIPDPRTKEDDRLRKQEEAKRDLYSADEFIEEIFIGEDGIIEIRHLPGKHNQAEHAGGRAGMTEATPERKAEFKEKIGRSIPPAWTDVHIADDLDNSALLVQGRDGKGRLQSWYSSAHTKAQAEKKFTRIKALSGHTDKLDAALDRDALVNDEAGALTLIRRLGMRPGSNSNTGAKVQAHGATNLKAKHVKLNDDGSATLDFTGKDGVHIVLKTKDEKVIDVLRSRKIGKGDEDPLFKTNEEKVRNYFRGPGGVPPEFLLKDLRTLKANTTALKEVKTIEPPKTKQEFLKKRKEVATTVSQQLGNDPSMALNSYINPTVFSNWDKDGSWS